MAFDTFRRLIVIALVIGGILGFSMGVLGVGSGGGWIALGFGLVAGLVTYWYYRKQKRTGAVDERYVQIQARASMWTQTFLLVGLSVLATVLIFTDVALPVGLVLVGFVLTAVIVDELCIEVYRRRI